MTINLKQTGVPVWSPMREAREAKALVESSLRLQPNNRRCRIRKMTIKRRSEVEDLKNRKKYLCASNITYSIYNKHNRFTTI